MARSAHLRPVKVGQFLEEHPPESTLHRLFAGSWISHNFAIWVGHPEDNQAWDALHAARSFLVAEERSLRHEAATLERAWNEIYIAQGSDWFWWYGDDHSSALDGLFDRFVPQAPAQRLYPAGLRPAGLAVRRDFALRRASADSRPARSFSHVKIDGRATYFEWIDAARYACGNERGTMTQVASGLLESVWFGFDAERLLIRVDTLGGPGARCSGRGRPAAHRFRRAFGPRDRRDAAEIDPAR